eukprot:2906194-Rhodomonas_salina.1
MGLMMPIVSWILHTERWACLRRGEDRALRDGLPRIGGSSVERWASSDWRIERWASSDWRILGLAFVE